MEEQNFSPNNLPVQEAPVITPSNELMPARNASHSDAGGPGQPEKPTMKINQNTILVGVAVLAVLILGAVLVTQTNLKDKIPFLGASNQKIAQKAVDFLNANNKKYLQGQTATVGKVSTQYGLVKLEVKIGGGSFESFATHDGKFLFPNVLTIDDSRDPAMKPVNIADVKIDGNPYVGNINSPVVLAFWSDYQCPFCKKAAQTVIAPMMAEYVASGKVKIVYKDYAFLGADSQTLAVFGRAVWEAAPAKFEAWHKAMYDNQGQENTGWATEAKIMEISTKAIGAVDANKALALSKKNVVAYQALIDADKAEGTGFGVNGTPGSIIGKKFINGAEPYAVFKAAIETVLNSK